MHFENIKVMTFFSPLCNSPAIKNSLPSGAVLPFIAQRPQSSSEPFWASFVICRMLLKATVVKTPGVFCSALAAVYLSEAPFTSK